MRFKKGQSGIVGKHHTKEWKMQMGRRLKLAWKKGLFDNRRNTPHSEEAKRNISKGTKKAWLTREKRLSENHKQKISEGHRRFRETHPNFQKGKNHPCYGKHRSHTQETIEKIRLARLKQIFPKEDTSIEVKLQNGLQERDIPFEAHNPVYSVGFGCQPDLFIQPNICVFADGDYWHSLPNRVESDLRQNKTLKEMGYTVLRFWEHEINENLEQCLDKIERIYFTV